MVVPTFQESICKVQDLNCFRKTNHKSLRQKLTSNNSFFEVPNTSSYMETNSEKTVLVLKEN
ncbi:hypothetical protein LIL_10342 [Leptospira interrogans serovar Linhai str. 56609]|nr:hypothetical protein LIL_10342 [Leptospira interrogans serovar Linhai str. 56609]